MTQINTEHSVVRANSESFTGTVEWQRASALCRTTNRKGDASRLNYKKI